MLNYIIQNILFMKISVYIIILFSFSLSSSIFISKSIDTSVIYDDTELENIRGRHISYIFQDPHTHLNPLLSVGYQINETIVKHKIANRNSSKKLTCQILSDVGLKSSGRIYNMYPFQLSGGMKQRVLIAIAICCKPEIIIADEPTTSLDSNIQRIIVELLMQLCKKYSISIIWITHNINLAKYVSNNIAIMYGGRIVEYGKKEEISSNPRHPYTKDLLRISDLKDHKKEIGKYFCWEIFDS